MNESRKKRSTSRASGDAGSAEGFAVVSVVHACSTAARPDAVASVLAACAATWPGSFRREKSAISRRRRTTSRSARAVSLPASSSSARSSASTSTTTPKHAQRRAGDGDVFGDERVAGAAAAALSAVNATMARPRSATSTSAATACLLTTAHAMRSNATRSVSTSEVRRVASATPSTETHRNANVSTVCAKTAGTME